MPRYEALPSNYGLSHNMMAGAFAGIAVCDDLIFGQRGTLGTNVGHTGTLGHVSCRSTQGMSIFLFTWGWE
jgi:hypothetical protein